MQANDRASGAKDAAATAGPARTDSLGAFGAGLLVFLLIASRRLLLGVLDVNDTVTLTWALQSVRPDWLPNDWFLNLPLGSQQIAGTLMGWLVDAVGFVAASLTGRLIAYALLAGSLTVLVRRLGVPVAWLMVVLFAFLLGGQSLGAGEWIFGAAESKAVAYAAVLLGLAFLVEERWVAAAAAFGAATSIHMLVGGYAFGALALLALLHRVGPGIALRGLLVYMLLGAVGITNVLYEVLASWGGPDVSAIIVNLRHPHHMRPESFGAAFPYRLALCAFAWLAVYAHARHHAGARRLLGFAALAMLPFLAGLLAAPFDTQGRLLKYYPFRLGDALFPLCVLLAGYFVAARWIDARRLRVGLVGAAALVLAFSAVRFVSRARDFAPRPSSDPAWVEACTWIRESTPPDALVVAPPARESFTLLARRATIVQFKFFPFSQAAVPIWHRRLLDLVGETPVTGAASTTMAELNRLYYARSGAQLAALMERYGAEWVVTDCRDRPGLKREFTNGEYCVLRRPAT